MNKAIHAYVDAGRTPGVVTLIARHGKVVHVDAYGKADLARAAPRAPTTSSACTR